MTTTDYEPIDCDHHSALEVLALRRSPVVVKARTAADGAEFFISGRVQDVLTRDGGEYLELYDQVGNPVSVRLDRLLRIATPTGEVIWRQKGAAGR